MASVRQAKTKSALENQREFACSVYVACSRIGKLSFVACSFNEINVESIQITRIRTINIFITLKSNQKQEEFNRDEAYRVC